MTFVSTSFAATDPQLINTGEDVLQETPTQPSVQAESNPGSSQTRADTENSDGVDFKIKEEQEKLGVKTWQSNTGGYFSFWSCEKWAGSAECLMNCGQFLQTALQFGARAMAATRSGCRATEHGQRGRDERYCDDKMAARSRKRCLMGDSPARSWKARRLCPTCGKAFQYVCPFINQVKTHKKTSESTKELLRHLQRAHMKHLVCDVARSSPAPVLYKYIQKYT